MDVHPIALGNPEFEGKNNAYLVRSAGTTALVDTGIARRTTRETLETGLSTRGFTFSDVDLVLLTHWHPDHAGLAGTIQAAGGATVLSHERDAPLVRDPETAMRSLLARQRARFEEWGMPADKEAAVVDTLRANPGAFDRRADVEDVVDGQRIDVGDARVRVRHAPGHTDGSCCFEFTRGERLEAFVGDAVLPVYTPNVGGADVRVENPLGQYLETLTAIAARGYDRLLPGHRHAIDEPESRARTIVAHHRERTDRVLEVLSDHGPADAWTVSAHLFGDLDGIHVMHGPGEAYAHLDHLERRGVVDRTGDEYQLIDGDGSPDPDASA